MAYEELAPSIRIQVEGQDVSADVTNFIISCKVEQSQEMAWKIDIEVLNVQNDALGAGWDGTYLFTDSKLFQPGNTIVVYMGYSGQEEFVGAGIIQKYLPSFPSDGPPVLKIVAYDGRVILMDSETAQESGAWEDTPHSDVVQDIADRQGFLSEITETLTEKHTMKKQGMSDWELVQGLARLHGYYAAVEWDADTSNWKLLWGPADEVFPQTKQYTLTYSVDGQDNTLLEFHPEMVIKGLPSSLMLHYFDKDTRTWEEVLFEETDEGESLKYTGTSSGSPEEEVLSSSAFKISASGVSIEVVPRTQFENAEDALIFAERWFKARKEQFITGRGRTVGLEVLRPGHIHIITGIGIQLSGEYQFTTVVHEYTSDNGYKTQFFSHKVVS